MKKVINCVSSGNILPDERNIYMPLINAGFIVDFNHIQHTQDEQVVINAVKGYDYVIAGSEIWSRNVFEQAKGSVKMLVRHGVGMDNVDIDAARELGVPVSNTPGANAHAVAEHALGMLLSLLRKITKYDRDMRNGIWKCEITRPLSGKVGLIGFGATAQAFARLLQPFPVEISAYDIAFDKQAADETGVTFCPPEEIINKCDIISIHVAVTPETTGMVNSAFIQKMKPDAILVNTSRGAVVNEVDLFDALSENKIAGAALDVFVEEPVSPDNPLCKLENTIITPHAASASFDSLKKMASQCVSNILDFEAGKNFKGLIVP